MERSADIMQDSKGGPIPGTTIFDGAQAQKGYALNRMCFSFNDAANREAFRADEDAYCARYRLTPDQREAVRSRNVLKLIEAGGKHLLPRQAGGDPRSQRAGRRRAADRPHRRGLQGQAQRSGGSLSAMAKIIGGLGVSHVPAIGKAMAQHLEEDPYWKPFFDGFGPARAWLRDARPDAVVVLYNDHGLNFFLDKMPAFAVGAAPEYRNADEGWGLPVQAPFMGAPDLSWSLIESLSAEEFDLTTCQEMLVDHAFCIPMSLFWGKEAGAIPTVPIAINTVQHPIPSPARCYKLGQAIGRAIESYPKDLRVAVIATGGLSHQLDGERAGFINRAFDEYCLDKLVNDPKALTQYSSHDLVELAGSQGVELLMWIAMAGAMTGEVHQVQRHYHIPISNTAAALLVLENRPRTGRRAA
jgi:protocatechuate 4,5-dioxygenase beta chain